MGWLWLTQSELDRLDWIRLSCQTRTTQPVPVCLPWRWQQRRQGKQTKTGSGLTVKQVATSVNPKFTLVIKHQQLLSATVSANITKYDQKHSTVSPKITWVWHSRIKTVAGFRRSDIQPFQIDPPWIKKRGANQSGMIKQEAQLSMDRAMRRVSWNLANCHATVQKLLVRQVVNKSELWSWRVTVGRCVINMCTQLWRDRVASTVL